MDRNHGEVNYSLTQFLSGHGYFNEYLARMGKVEDAACQYHDTIKDDAHHTSSTERDGETIEQHYKKEMRLLTLNKVL